MRLTVTYALEAAKPVPVRVNAGKRGLGRGEERADSRARARGGCERRVGRPLRELREFLRKGESLGALLGVEVV